MPKLVKRRTVHQHLQNRIHKTNVSGIGHASRNLVLPIALAHMLIIKRRQNNADWAFCAEPLGSEIACVCAAAPFMVGDLDGLESSLATDETGLVPSGFLAKQLQVY